MNTAARTNRPRARKLNAVPVLVRTLVNEVDRTEVVMDGMETFHVCDNDQSDHHSNCGDNHSKNE